MAGKRKVGSDVPLDLEPEQKLKVGAWFRRTYPDYWRGMVEHHGEDRARRELSRFLQDEVIACLNWHAERDNPKGIVKWERAVMRWVGNTIKWKRERMAEQPQERREPGARAGLRLIAGDKQ